MRDVRLFSIAAFLLVSVVLIPPSTTWAEETNADSDSSAHGDDPPPRSSFIPFPIIFYQPETGTGFGASLLYLFQLSGTTPAEEDSRYLQSSLSATGIYTTKKQIITSLRTELFPGGGRYRILADAGFVRFPTKFWGIGNDTPDALEEDYTPGLVAFSGEFQKEFASGWYAGGFGRVAYRDLVEVEPGGLLDSGRVPGDEDGTVVGLGLLMSRDTRSSNVYPHSGSYHQFRATLYDGFFGSRYEFSSYSLDLRKFLGLSASSVLALRGLGIASGGTPPFDLMPQLGGDALLRGYFAGRFRDRDLLAFQAEYRSPFWWKFGAAVFASAGQVAGELGGFKLNQFHPGAGFGLRFQLSREEELNIRMDFAWGFDVESSGFYLGFGEVF
jgi:hypothetical protein